MEERRILSEKLFCHTPRSTENKSSEDNVVDLINLSEAFSKPNDIIFLENDDTENKNPKMECPGELSTDSNTKVKNPSPRQSNSIITSFIKHRKTENNSESSYDYALETENGAGKKADAQRYLLFRVEKLMRYLHEFNNDEIERKMYFDFDMPQMLPVQVRKGNLNCILFQQCLNKIMPDIEWMSEARFRRVILEEVLIGNPRVFRRLKSGTRNAWKLRKNHGTGKSRTENNGTENLENVHRVDINETDDESSQDTCSSVDSYFETPKLYRQFDQVELNGSGENTADNSSESENDAKIEIKNKSPKSKSQKNNTKTSEPSTDSESSFANKTTLKKSPKSNHPVFDHNNRDFEQEYKNYESQIQTRLGKYSVYEKKLKEKQVKQIKNRIETERTMKKNEGIESEIITKPIKSSYYNAEGYYEETNERDENYEPAYNEKYSALKNCGSTTSIW